MTLIAIDAVVDVPGNLFVLEVVGVVSAMASRALEHRVIVGIGVTRGANAICIAMRRWELRVLRVIERRSGPRGGVVARLTGRREKLRLRRMTRVRGVVVVGLMAADAGRGERRVVVVDMAVGTHARRHQVRASQGEGCGVVVEGGVGPRGSVVTKLARGGESCRGVRRIGGATVILLVARIAERAVQRIVVVDVAVGAGARRHGVLSGQLESGAGVVEGAVRPLHGVVAGFARRGESGRDMVHRRQGVVVVRLVTRDAGGAGQVVVVVDVAIGALARWHCVRSGQDESGAVVVERGVQPGAGAMALVAGLREVAGHVVRIRCALIVLEVAGDAGRTGEVVVVIDVAVGASPRRHRVQSR